MVGIEWPWVLVSVGPATSFTARSCGVTYISGVGCSTARLSFMPAPLVSRSPELCFHRFWLRLILFGDFRNDRGSVDCFPRGVESRYALERSADICRNCRKAVAAVHKKKQGEYCRRLVAERTHRQLAVILGHSKSARCACPPSSES